MATAPIMNFRIPQNWSPRGLRMDAHRVKDPRPRPAIAEQALAFGSVILTPTASIALALILADTPAPAPALLKAFAAAPAPSRRLMLHWVPAAQALDSATIEALIDRALGDRSGPVRAMAVDAVQRADLPRLLPRLARMHRQERSPAIRRDIATHIALLKMGYKARRDAKRRCWWVTARTRTGGQMYFSLEFAEVRRHGLKGAVARQLADLDPA